jgi:signal transduction histidine kinase
MKTLIFAKAAHEFRNPLSGIISSLDLLEDKVDRINDMDSFKIAKNCSNLMLFLVNDILDLA